MSGPWDVVFFTGDLANAGDPAEYDELDRILERTWEHFGSLGSSPLLLPVPGNHDLVRPNRRKPEADRELKAFRSSHAGAARFTDPGQLPGLVAAMAARALQTRASGAHAGGQAGFRPWELAYLQARLATWRAGRTSTGRAYLVDTEGRAEVYAPELYVPMDGRCARWLRGADHRLVSAEPADNSDPKDDEEAVLRMREPKEKPQPSPLAWWVCRPELPRIALVGSPGGGKTVFLTRLAAAVASACLGAPAEMEELEVDGLRRQDGGLPIPILLDALRLAAHLHEARPLATALEKELSASGVDPRRLHEVEAGLQAGRYLLLVDAWDEIAAAGPRGRVLDLLKGAARLHPRLRLVLTTRSASYTGAAAFGPELEVLELQPLSDGQVRGLIANWSRARKRDAAYEAELRSAVDGVGLQVGAGGANESLVVNPLMLTAVCTVYERYRRLPDDRARLCELLVTDLCAARRSEDVERGWRLDEAGKRDLLDRIALKMQEAGAQSWPEGNARGVALQELPAADPLRELRAARHLVWAAEHTGLLRFDQPADGPEQVRFRHRLFREFLAAHRLGRENKTVETFVRERATQIEDPFWEDLIRLLPRVLGARERAEALVATLQELAEKAGPRRGRFLGLAMAAVIESRDLFPAVDPTVWSCDLAAVYEQDAGAWPLLDRLLFLEGPGLLDEKGGDPRLRPGYREPWVSVPEGEVTLSEKFLWGSVEPGAKAGGQTVRVSPFSISWAPVTVQEYRCFVLRDQAPSSEAVLWKDVPKGERKTVSEAVAESWRTQLRHPNRPIVNVSAYEATAYCRWRTLEERRNGRLAAGQAIRLPTEAEWQWAAERPDSRTYPWPEGEPGTGDAARANWSGLGLQHATPVGAFPAGARDGIVDLAGNVWEWCEMVPPTPERRAVRGGSCFSDDAALRCVYRYWDLSLARLDLIGLRLVRSAGT
ncbi:MAG: SUMF1/EgtB/PvdO family nonheme iron enzyme [Planctomycetes bacterium]|nr:SUMF1/EgtB/PvdO family nonheme iron enzyme [Planctomycetota bacterium]